MVLKSKAKFLPLDYQLSLFKRLQNLRQRETDIKEYTEEFYKLTIRVGHVEDDPEKIGRYVNGLCLNIQDEITLLNFRSIEEAYQSALKVEEKLSRRQQGTTSMWRRNQ